ncbi:hypothetical protein F5Y12DRAFT_549518 [Xylaria sp. FL1777]|nr:hypothetical protein F5Y12DRAFT_549518 [Xylaria sp. FL1777]
MVRDLQALRYRLRPAPSLNACLMPRFKTHFTSRSGVIHSSVIADPPDEQTTTQSIYLYNSLYEPPYIAPTRGENTQVTGETESQPPNMCSSDLFLGLIAILFPPLAVWVKCGICSADSTINILLCILGYIPGLLHAWYIIAKFPDTDDYERVPQDYESGYGGNGSGGGGRGRVTYVIVPAPHPQPNAQSQPQQQQPKHGRPVNYGTTTNTGAGASSSTPSHQDEAGGSSSDRAPPTYAEAIQGDHKIQSDE